MHFLIQEHSIKPHHSKMALAIHNKEPAILHLINLDIIITKVKYFLLYAKDHLYYSSVYMQFLNKNNEANVINPCSPGGDSFGTPHTFSALILSQLLGRSPKWSVAVSQHVMAIIACKKLPVIVRVHYDN